MIVYKVNYVSKEGAVLTVFNFSLLFGTIRKIKKRVQQTQQAYVDLPVRPQRPGLSFCERSI